MFTLLLSAIFSIRSWFRSRAALQVEILALRHQLTVLKRSQRGRLRLNSADRLLWALPPLVAVALGAAYRKARNGDLLASKRVPLVLETEESAGRTGKAAIDWEVRELIGKMSLANPVWGAPRIHGKLLKLSIEVSQATVAKYMVRQGNRPPKRGGLS